LRRDLGDFQTPPALVAEVLDALGPVGRRWPRVLEPSCGRGHFLAGLVCLADPPREVIGIEIQEDHCRAAREAVAGSSRVEVIHASLFGLDLRRDLPWRDEGPLLVVGNPPWVTNAELGSLGSGNHPRKANVKGLRGIDARTGASNFDVAEAVWLKLIAELADQEPTIALLCKTSVARNVLEFAAKAGLPVAEASLSRIDARRWFGAAVDACLFRVALGPERPVPVGRRHSTPHPGPPPHGGREIEGLTFADPRWDGEESASLPPCGGGPGWGGAPGNLVPGRVPVFADLRAATPEAVMGFARGRLVADIDAYRPRAFADGRCPLSWRQGLKHDAAAVMELARGGDSGTLRNRLGEDVDVEPEYVYPLLKGADLIGPRRRPGRAVIVTQAKIGQDTRHLEESAPRLWAYLRSHGAAFENRRSSIYRGQPPFAMFGVGPYSFAPYKVAVSGLHKAPAFRAVGPDGGRPVMLDDTGYFLPCRSPEQAAMLSAMLNDPEALGLINALTFRDAKRPITKALLQRIDLSALATRVDRDALIARAEGELGRLRDGSASPDLAAPIPAP
jgi:hypothetical protein